MAKKGFKGQWVEISRQGKIADSTGVERDLNGDFLKSVIANFEADTAPAVVGHPQNNGPAYGWVSDVRLNNGVLEAQFADTDDDFEQMCADKKFRKRSASFYMNPPRLRHVGFLGATPPAIKGLRDISFNDGDAVTVEISFSEEDKIMSTEKETQEEKKTLKEWMKEFFGGEKPAAPAAATTANFSEADAKRIADEAVKAATETLTASFNEKYSALETKLGTMSGKGRRGEIEAFVESIPAESGRHFLKNIGVADFMEALANADDADTEKAVVCFSEVDGKKEEHKFSRYEWAKTYFSSLPKVISFGEKFGDIVVTQEVAETVEKRPDKVKSLKEKVGVVEGGAK